MKQMIILFANNVPHKAEYQRNVTGLGKYSHWLNRQGEYLRSSTVAPCYLETFEDDTRHPRLLYKITKVTTG